MRNERLPEVIIVEMLDGSVISAELVKVVNDSNLPISVAHYRESQRPHLGGPIEAIRKRMDAHTQNAVALVQKAMGMPEKAMRKTTAIVSGGFET